MLKSWILAVLLAGLVAPAYPQYQGEPIPDAPARLEGEGPFDRLILRGAILIDGSGSPPMGPVDIVVERNRITEIRNVGFPGGAIDPERRAAAPASHLFAGRGSGVGHRGGGTRGGWIEADLASSRHHDGHYRPSQERGPSDRLSPRANGCCLDERAGLRSPGAHPPGALVRSAGGAFRRPP